MSPDTSARPVEEQRTDETPSTAATVDSLRLTYQYLRLVIIGLLLALGAALVVQTGRQGWHPLASVSAYYWTPARTVFVSSLVGFAACMVALRGTRPVEDVALNLAGAFAVLVAVVPTSRGEDYRAAVEACRQTSSETVGVPRPDCPTVVSLEQAAQDDVFNGVVAFVVVAVIGLVAAVLLHSRNLRQALRSPFGAGLGLAVVLTVCVLLAFLLARQWFVAHAHLVSAAMLALCIVVVAAVNARRHHESTDLKPGLGVASDRYSVLAALLVAASIVGAVLLRQDVISLFWLEVVVAGLFGAFWVVQTLEDPALRPDDGSAGGEAGRRVGEPTVDVRETRATAAARPVDERHDDR